MRRRRTTPAEQKLLRRKYCEEEAPEEEAPEEEALSVKEEEDSLEVEEALSVKEEEASDNIPDKPLCMVMAKFLRYTAFVENLLDEGDWIELDDSVLCRLRTSLEEVVEVVRTSNTRWDYARGYQPRFEMTISGRHTWLRATNCSFYRNRSLERAGLA